MNKGGTSLALLSLCCIGLAAIAQQQHDQLSASEREHILDGQFEVIRMTEGIPAKVKREFSILTREPLFALADPGQKFQVADVVIDRSLPRRRLVFAGRADEKWFIHYERGGRGHGYYVVVFKIDSQGEALFLWGGSGGTGAKNLEQLRKMVAAGQFSDAENYYW